MAERMLTYAEAIQEALDEEMTRDPSVYVLGEDVAIWGNLFGCTKGLLAKYGKERVRDTPISEAALMGCAVGSAASGMRPVAEIMYIDFISIAIDQIINHAARWHQLSGGKVKVPLVVRTQGGVGFRNSSQHSQSLENWFVNIPGLVVVMPSTPYDVKGLLKASIRDDNPVIFIEHKAVYRNKGNVPKEDYVVPLGVAEVKRAGTDLTIVANSWMVLHALEAAEELAKAGHQRRGRGPPHSLPAGREDDHRLGAKDRSLPGGERSPGRRRVERDGRLDGDGALLLRHEETHGEAVRTANGHPLRQGPGAGGCSPHGGRGPRSQSASRTIGRLPWRPRWLCPSSGRR